jgi:uncharacterized protein (TIGR01777 family)
MNRKVLITGATGLIGSKLAKRLYDLGFKVYSVSRDVKKSEIKFKIPIKHISYDEDKFKNIIDNNTIIINLAGASIAGNKWTEEYKKVIYDSRILTTRKLVDILNNYELKPELFINASAIGIYGNTFDKIIDENTPVGEGFLAQVTFDWENELTKLSNNIRKVYARIGIVLDLEGGALAKMLLPYKLFIGGPLGTGKQWMSWIHIDDLIELFVFIIQKNNINGAINLTAPNPVTMDEFSHTIGKILRRPSFFKVPEFILKIILGESSAMVLNSNRVIPKKAIENGYNFEYDNLEKALKNLLKKYQ